MLIQHLIILDYYGRSESIFSFKSYEALQKMDEEIYGLKIHKIGKDKNFSPKDIEGIEDIDKKFGYIPEKTGYYLDNILSLSLKYILKRDEESNVFDRTDMFMSMISHYPNLKYISQKELIRQLKSLLNEYLQIKDIKELEEIIKYEQYPDMEFIKCKLNQANNVAVKITNTNSETNEEEVLYYFILPERKGKIKYMKEEEWKESIESKKVELEDKTKDDDILK